MEKNEILLEITSMGKKFGKFLIGVLIFGLGYFSCELYHMIKSNRSNSNTASSPKVTKKIDKVSVAINERNELMIIDRTDGSYDIYQDSIGRCIFNLYANRIQTKYQNP
jgi:hypothetical protein